MKPWLILLLLSLMACKKNAELKIYPLDAEFNKDFLIRQTQYYYTSNFEKIDRDTLLQKVREFSLQEIKPYRFSLNYYYQCFYKERLFSRVGHWDKLEGADNDPPGIHKLHDDLICRVIFSKNVEVEECYSRSVLIYLTKPAHRYKDYLIFNQDSIIILSQEEFEDLKEK